MLFDTNKVQQVDVVEDEHGQIKRIVIGGIAWTPKVRRLIEKVTLEVVQPKPDTKFTPVWQFRLMPLRDMLREIGKAPSAKYARRHAIDKYNDIISDVHMGGVSVQEIAQFIDVTIQVIQKQLKVRQNTCIETTVRTRIS